MSLCRASEAELWLSETHLTRVQPVQALVDPLLNVEAPLQLLPVVLHRNPSVSLRDTTPALLVVVILDFGHEADPLGCHVSSGVIRLVSRLFKARGHESSWEATATRLFFLVPLEMFIDTNNAVYISPELIFIICLNFSIMLCFLYLLFI